MSYNSKARIQKQSYYHEEESEEISEENNEEEDGETSEENEENSGENSEESDQEGSQENDEESNEKNYEENSEENDEENSEENEEEDEEGNEESDQEDFGEINPDFLNNIMDKTERKIQDVDRNSRSSYATEEEYLTVCYLLRHSDYYTLYTINNFPYFLFPPFLHCCLLLFN